MNVADTLAIHQLLALYGHVVDEREWDRMDELLTADLVFRRGRLRHRSLPRHRQPADGMGDDQLHPLTQS